jgi:hypothetical protein
LEKYLTALESCESFQALANVAWKKGLCLVLSVWYFFRAMAYIFLIVDWKNNVKGSQYFYRIQVRFLLVFDEFGITGKLWLRPIERPWPILFFNIVSISVYKSLLHWPTSVYKLDVSWITVANLSDTVSFFQPSIGNNHCSNNNMAVVQSIK